MELRREGDNKHDIAWSLNALASVVREQGEYNRARALLEESLILFRELGNIRGIALSLLGLAWVLFLSQSDAGRIPSLLEEGDALRRELDDKPRMADLLSVLSGEIALSRGDASMAHSLAEESVVLDQGDR